MAVGDSVDLARCRTLFDEVMRLVESRCVRPEPRRTARAFVSGLLSAVERKNCWWLAEHVGHARPDAMQRLLASAVWDADAVRDDLRTLMVTRLAHPDGVLIVDETGHVKKGVCSVGVQRQYTGTAGRIENSQVAVYLGYASPHSRALIDRRLYLPREGWCDDPQRRAAAGVPTSVQFATKPQLATEMILASMQAGAAARWVTADEVYGGNPQFRAALRGRRIGYVLAVGCHTRVELPAGRRRVDAAVAQLPVAAWQRRSAGAGSKGPRHYDWAWMQLADSADDTSLLVRRNRSTGELAYYLCWSPDPQPLAALVAVAGRRWAIEETFQTAKSQIGLDHHQLRRWTSWHRFATLTMVALAYLVLLTASATPTPLTRPANPSAPEPGLPDLRHPVTLTIAELRHLIAHLIIKPVVDAVHLLSWSAWRRRHQATARRCHHRRRLTS